MKKHRDGVINDHDHDHDHDDDDIDDGMIIMIQINEID